ncbi:Set1 complex component spp1 [Arthroderma uncinatum]|uniref:Set1 complex component spp1 n=1 Tax=Arthroderma uncinatum TaxID=74035 RepID=UPI00144AF5BB|nr:Set1 complex component spp1 [Arthroderma uncinatum]KAF3491730.1 Set1 complex component spp1 [Arthroderma uncinatum]
MEEDLTKPSASASTSTPEPTSLPGPSLPEREAEPVPSAAIESNPRLREIEPLFSPAPFRGSLFPSPTPGPSQCSDSSPRPRIPSSPLGTPGPFFMVGAPRYDSPGSSLSLESEPRLEPSGSPQKLDRYRNVLHPTRVPTKLAPSGSPIFARPTLATASDTLPPVFESQPVYSKAMSTPSDMQDATKPADTPPQYKNATFNAMEHYTSDSAPVDAASSSQAPSLGHQAPGPGDVRPDARYIMSTDPESIKYWEAALDRCNSETRINTPRIGGRDTFVLGSVVVKSDHLDPSGGSGYHMIDANEDAAIKLVRDTIADIQLPQTYFSAKIRGHDVLVHSRIPGQSLDSVWPQLTVPQKEAFKQQARDIILKLRLITPDTLKYPRYFVTSSESESQRKLSAEEVHSLSPSDTCEDLGVAHNDMVMSNFIVNNDKIVGLTGWANAGYFNWRTVSRIHAKVRCVDSNMNASIPEAFDSEVPWHDLYDLPHTSEKSEAQESATPRISTPTVDSAHTLPSEDVPTHTLTPKKVADMKLKSASRASSVDRSSPAPSLNSQSATKKKGPPAAAIKKGTAKRAPAAKKRKLNELAEMDDVASTKASPLSKSSAQRNRKQDSQSATGSPAPENKGPKKVRSRHGKMNSDDDDDDYDESALFCVCRKPDNHTWMIACDGGCEDWFHGRCMNIDQKDADLIDKYICPTCETKSPLRTTWKPMCRLRECRQPARVDTRPPSKYCCDQHGIDFMRQAMTLGSRQPSSNAEEQSSSKHENAASRGGVLNLGELKTVVSKVESAGEFRKLGASPLSVQQEEVQARLSGAMAAPGPSQDGQQFKDPDFESEADKVAFSPDERQRLNHLRKEKVRLDNRKEMLQAREKFIVISKQRVKHAFERLKRHGSVGGLQLKDICGFDNRLSLSDEEFDEWRKTGNGAILLSDVPDDDNGGEASTHLKNAVDAESIDELTQSLCLKKRCERHKQWLKVMQQDLLFEQSLLKEQSDKCHQDAEELVRKAVLWVFGGNN